MQYIIINKMMQIPYDDFIKRACKLTKAKGQFPTTEANLRDYIRVTPDGNPKIDATIYRDCFDLMADIQRDIQFGGGKPCAFIKTKRNQISARLLFKLLETICLP